MLALLGAVVIWGITPVATRFLVGGTTQKITPSALLALRYSLSAVVLLPLAYRAQFHCWERRDQIICLFAGLCASVGYSLPVTLGQVTVSAGTTALIIATEPVWIVILWALRKRTLPTWGAVLGAFIGLAGIAILETGDMRHFKMETFMGVSLVLLGAFFWSVYCVLAAGLIRRKGALAVTSTSVVIGCLPYLLISGAELPEAVRGMDTAGLVAVGLLAFGSVIVATIFWNHGIAKLPGPRSGAFLHAVPIVGVLCGYSFLGEDLSLPVVLAAALVTSGVVMAQFDDRTITRPHQERDSS